MASRIRASPSSSSSQCPVYSQSRLTAADIQHRSGSSGRLPGVTVTATNTATNQSARRSPTRMATLHRGLVAGDLLRLGGAQSLA
jgi:hypothetical protein